MTGRGAIGVALLAALACEPDRGAMARDTRVLPHMAKRDVAARDLRDAIVHGQLEEAQRDARRWAEVAPRDLPEGLQSYEADVTTTVMRIAVATSLDDAAQALGDLAVACGACHAAAGANLPVLGPAAPVAGDGVRAEMQRHDAAMERLWAGLLRPSDEDVAAAAELFASSSLAPIGGPNPSAAAFDDEATRLAGRAAAAATPEARADRFGELVVTCAACHLVRPGGIAIEPE